MNIVKTCTANLDGLRIMYLKKHPPVIFMLFLIFQDGMKFIYFNIKFTLEGCNEFSRYSLFLNLWTGQLLSGGFVQCGYTAPTELESPRRVINLYIIIQVQSVSSTYDVIKAITSIWRENMLGYLTADIICSEKPTAFRQRSSRKTVSFEEQIMSRDKYQSIFSRQMEAIEFIIL